MMSEVTSVVIATALVPRPPVPVAFFPGTTGRFTAVRVTIAR